MMVYRSGRRRLRLLRKSSSIHRRQLQFIVSTTIHHLTGLLVHSNQKPKAKRFLMGNSNGYVHFSALHQPTALRW